MNKRIENIVNNYLKKKSIVYERSLGAEEVTLFMLRAPEEKQDAFMRLLSEKKMEEAMKMVEEFLGIEEGELWKAMHSKG